jgi:class 3 adenylate cyclase
MTSKSSHQAVKNYVPGLVLNHLAARQGDAPEPYSEDLSSVVLFADISGFTSLTEQLAHKGHAGAEVLTQIINDYFTQLIELLLDHGGDIFKFAGDALIALWPGDSRADCQCRRGGYGLYAGSCPSTLEGRPGRLVGRAATGYSALCQSS